MKWAFGVLVSVNLITFGALYPWAMHMQSDMAAVRTKLEGLVVPPAWFKAIVDRNTSDIDELERRLSEHIKHEGK